MTVVDESTLFTFSPFFSLVREDAHRDSRPWFMPKSAPFIISLSPFPFDCPNHFWHCWMCACVKLETQTSVHANLTRPSIRHSTLWPTKKGVPYPLSFPPFLLFLVLPLAVCVSSTNSQGMEGRKHRIESPGCFGQCWLYLQLVWKQEKSDPYGYIKYIYNIF